jgi:hypothetical protein
MSGTDAGVCDSAHWPLSTRPEFHRAGLMQWLTATFTRRCNDHSKSLAAEGPELLSDKLRDHRDARRRISTNPPGTFEHVSGAPVPSRATVIVAWRSNAWFPVATSAAFAARTG